jgi:hypothetical protein
VKEHSFDENSLALIATEFNNRFLDQNHKTDSVSHMTIDNLLPQLSEIGI